MGSEKVRNYYQCKKCNKPFSFSLKRVKWFEDHQLSMPVHCSECLKKGRKKNDNR